MQRATQTIEPSIIIHKVKSCGKSSVHQDSLHCGLE